MTQLCYIQKNNITKLLQNYYFFVTMQKKDLTNLIKYKILEAVYKIVKF